MADSRWKITTGRPAQVSSRPQSAGWLAGAKLQLYACIRYKSKTPNLNQNPNPNQDSSASALLVGPDLADPLPLTLTAATATTTTATEASVLTQTQLDAIKAGEFVKVGKSSSRLYFILRNLALIDDHLHAENDHCSFTPSCLRATCRLALAYLACAGSRRPLLRIQRRRAVSLAANK